MISTTSLIAGIAILAVGTYAMRISGILLNNKNGMSERVKEMFFTFGNCDPYFRLQ